MQRSLILLSLLLAPAFALAADAAFPGFAATPGGRGGQLLRVTTLKKNGPGSLAEALATKGPRIIVFEVGGVIDLAGKSLKVSEPFVTIAGQTAPSPGITLIRGGLNIAAHDVIVQHIRSRAGEAGHAKKSGWEVDSMGTISAYNVIVDHCSCTWATDENLSASGPRFDGDNLQQWQQHTSHNITFSNCIIAEGLSKSTHAKGEHSKGSLIHDNTTNIALIANLYASNMQRNPFCKGGTHVVIVNNWITNPGRYAMHHNLSDKEWAGHPHATSRLAVVGNVMEYGPDTPANLPLFHNHAGPLDLFLADNLAFDRDHKPVPMTDGPAHILPDRPLWPAGLTPLPADKVKEYVARNAGARPWDRDPIDQRIVKSALDGTGHIINSEQEAGGYPTVPPTHAPFNPDDWDLTTLQPRQH